MKALWARSRDEVDRRRVQRVLQARRHDWADPLEIDPHEGRGHLRVPGAALHPVARPCDLFMREARRGVQLYVKRVFIMDDCDALMPDYLRFVKGVVDAHDLSLNISREILQQDRQIQHDPPPPGQEGARHDQGACRPTSPQRYRHVLDRVRPGGQGGPARATPTTGRRLLDIISVASTHDPAEPTTLAEYVERMKDGQSDIYYMTGESRSADGELAAPGGVPRQGLRGADADRPGRRGLGRAGRASSTARRCSRSPRARSTWTATRTRRPSRSASSSARNSPSC